ncbi:MAG: nucleotidyltransferase domain-containing protein [Acidimicrobiales bacterium]
MQQGIVRATQMGRNQVHELNRDHVAAPIAELLSGLRLELWRRLRETLAAWDVGPVYAGAFGSAARGDGGPDSDIDVLLVHPPLPGEEPPPRQRAKPIDLLGDRAATWPWRNAIPTAAQAETWHAQVDELHAKVQRWTGNPLQLVDISVWQWMGRSRTDPELFREIEDDAVALAGQLIPLPPRVR